MLKPFENDHQSTAIDDLTVENQQDCVSLYGNIQITKDQIVLQHAKALQSLINAIVTTLEQADLPEQIEHLPEQEIDNPFL